MERITFSVDSSITIVGSYWQGKGRRAVILLHMMPATKESWIPLADRLHKAGMHVLAVDLRGHGESVRSTQGILEYALFTNEQHQASIADVEGAREWLHERGIAYQDILLGGASIGASLAMQYLARHSEASAAFLLSPGLAYRGIEILPLARQLHSGQRLFIASAEDDPRVANNAAEARQIADAASCTKLFIPYAAGGHGTDILVAHPELMDAIVTWLTAPQGREAITDEVFEDLVASAYESLPSWVKEKIKNVALVVEDEPTEEERRAQGLSGQETLLGLYVGIPATARGTAYGMGPTLPDKIVIYKIPIIEAGEGDPEKVKTIVRDTVYHEFAHHFGMDEDAVQKREKKGW